MITRNVFETIIELLGEQGQQDITWAQDLRAPEDNFALEIIYVICNSGMKHAVARKIYDDVTTALHIGQPVAEVFGHPGKAAAMEQIWRDRTKLMIAFLQCEGQEARLAWCGALPWIGEITKYHIAKNFGVADFAKPDVHLQRLADREGVSVQALCERLAAETGLRVATVDTILWRACATGVVDSTTGELKEVA